MKTTFNTQGFLDNISATLAKPQAVDPAERLFDNLVMMYAKQYAAFASMPFADSLENDEERKRMNYMQNSLHQRLNKLIFEKQYGPLFERALELQPEALDTACGIIIEHFFEDKIFSRAEMDWNSRKLLADHDIELNSDLGQDMIRAAQETYHDYKTLHYRAIAGGLFGLFATDEEADEYRSEAANLLEKAVNAVYERHYPDDPEPTGP